MSLTDEQIYTLGIGGVYFCSEINMQRLCIQAREANALRADAERYRWLRANEGTDDGGILVVNVSCDASDYIGMEILDAAIDAARLTNER